MKIGKSHISTHPIYPIHPICPVYPIQLLHPISPNNPHCNHADCLSCLPTNCHTKGFFSKISLEALYKHKIRETTTSLNQFSTLPNVLQHLKLVVTNKIKLCFYRGMFQIKQQLQSHKFHKVSIQFLVFGLTIPKTS